MFNGYNETPLISYDYNQDRLEKKQENAPKWSYGHEPGVQPAQSHPGNRQPEFWSGKPSFVGLSNVVKCSCTGCYPTSENQSYQGDTTCLRPWLPRTFPVPLNGSNELCKLPAYQWDNGSLNQGSYYPETNVPFVQESGGKHTLYRHYQESRLLEPNQPGVITSLKSAEFGKKQKQETSLQNGLRQPVFCNPVYNLTKRADGRNYCDPNEKYSNAASYSAEQHVPRLPVVEPYIKAVPSNLSQNRVPSTGYRSVKENVPQSYLDTGYGDSRKVCAELDIGDDKRNEPFPTGGIPSGTHLDYSNFGRDLTEAEPQKLFFDNGRHSDYYSKKNFQNVINRNNHTLDGRKDCMTSQIGQMSEQQYNVGRSKCQEAVKPSCETFYSKSFDKTRPENSPCFQRNEDKNEDMNVHTRLARTSLIFSDPRMSDRTQNSFPYQNNPAYRNYARPDYSYQGYNAQHRYEHPAGYQRSDFNQYRTIPQQTQTCEQFVPQQSNGFSYDTQCQQNTDKMAQFYGGKNPSPILMDSLSSESKKPTYLEQIRSEGMNKNGTSKISPLRLLRKKKFINVPQEPTSVATALDSAPLLDVRKFWSTWAEEEEESVTPTEVVVLDCQNIDPEQAKLLHLYETDPVRAVKLESGSIVLKGSGNADESAEVLPLEEVTAPEEVLATGPAESDVSTKPPQEQINDIEKNNSTPCEEPDIKPETNEWVYSTVSPFRPKAIKSRPENRVGTKSGVMDKWTEKKFDFLKRSEESKAAEILRHEEEKKKIFETRLSLRQSLKKMEKPQEKTPSNAKQGDERISESLSPLDENSQSSSVDGGGSNDMSNLPTSEYRRNKFLDYSDKKFLADNKDKNEKMFMEDLNILEAKTGESLDANEIKKETKKLENTLMADVPLPSLDVKPKDKPCFEMEDILQKISEINFQSSDVKLENPVRDEIVKKSRRSPSKKVKKKKSDHQPLNDERTDELTLETVKFSIQKSHDLKISFKVLNNSKKCSDEELGSRAEEVLRSPVEDSKNSTELFTLRYKSIQRDGDRSAIPESKKSRRRYRQKKNVPSAKTPVLKIKKSRYLAELERDPLGNYEDDEKDCYTPKPNSDGYSTSDDFHVHETVDSAKIKLTFKRNKANFETQYKINNSMGNQSELGPMCDESEVQEEMVKDRCIKKSRKADESEIFAEAGVESFHDNPETACDVDSGAESISREHGLMSSLEEDAKNSATSQDSYIEEENYLLESATTEIPSDTRLVLGTLRDGLYDNEELALENDNDNSPHFKENEKLEAVEDAHKSGEEQVELITNDVINEACGISLLGYSENSKDSTLAEVTSFEDNREKKRDFKREEIREISLDFISSTNSQEIEINDGSGKSEETEFPRKENNVSTTDENGDLERMKEFNYSEIQGSSCESNSKNERYNSKREILKASENLCEWEEILLRKSDSQEVNNIRLDDDDNMGSQTDGLSSSLPLFSCEIENVVQSCTPSEDHGRVMHDKNSIDVSSDMEKLTKAEGFEENAKVVEKNKENGNSYHSENEEGAGVELPSMNDDAGNAVENFTQNDIEHGSSPVDLGFRPDNVENLTEVTGSNASDNEKKSNFEQSEPKESGLLSAVKSTENFERVDFDCDSPSVLNLHTTSEDEQNCGGIGRAKDCCDFENGDPGASGKHTFEVATDSLPPEKTGCEISKMIIEEVQFSSVDKKSLKYVPRDDLGKREEDVGDRVDYDFSFAENTTDPPATHNPTVDVQNSEKEPEFEIDRMAENKVLQETEILASKKIENVAPSPNSFLEERTKNDTDSTGLNFQCTRSSEDNHEASIGLGNVRTPVDHSNNLVQSCLPSPSDVELEEGEIVDSSSDELEKCVPEKDQNSNKIKSSDEKKVDEKYVEFVGRKIERRNSTEPEILKIQNRESQISTWSKKKILKAKSCPPEMTLTGGQQCKDLGLDIGVEEIPLPLGPPPHYSCFDVKVRRSSYKMKSDSTKAKEKPKESISFKSLQIIQESPSCKSSFEENNLKTVKNPSRCEETKVPPPQLGILQRSSKIKFSFSRRSRFSKIVWKNAKEPSPEVLCRSNTKSLEKKEISAAFETDNKTTTPDCAPVEEKLMPAECQSEPVPNANIAKGTHEKNDEEELKEQENDFEQPVELLAEDLEVIGAMSDYMRDEFYECEDIPTSEDLTNGADLEIEKVNDDKFRNIMQNCLDNAKKFLNVGNLKLFSCSVDDLLELDSHVPDSALEEQETQPNHISRDVLLASCEDTNDDLGLSENMQPSDFSMDFVPSFGSDVCPEILPVDNWPYLEEEVPSSPIKSKQDETDLIPSLETASSNSVLNSADTHRQFYSKNGIDRRKRNVNEGCFKRFRRRSLLSDGESIRMCSKIGSQRRNTIDSVGGVPCGKDIRDLQSELMRWTNGKNDAEKQSLKCRLSLEKLRSKHGINIKFRSERMRRMSEDSLKGENGVRKKNGKILDYKSPSWQPKVMLFRISKSELRKLQRDSKAQKRLESKTAGDSVKREISGELQNQDIPSIKKQKPDSCVDEVYIKLEHENKKIDIATQNEERLVGVSGLESIKGSLSVIAQPDERKRKKLRFRNLYTKKRKDQDSFKVETECAQTLPFTKPKIVDAEAVLTEMFQEVKSAKDLISGKIDKKPKKKPTEIYSREHEALSSSKSEGKLGKGGGTSHSLSERQQQHKHREKLRKKDLSHRDRRREKAEHFRHRDRHKDSKDSGKGQGTHGASHQSKHSSKPSAGEHSDGSRRHSRDSSLLDSSGQTKSKSQGEPWSCDVCGFDIVEERVTHIKNHPFHCQSCHLAFKTETYFVDHLTKKHKNIRNQHHCLLCELSFDTEEQYQIHLETREHRHLESVEKNTINTLFTLLTGAPCPVLGLVEMKPEWLPNQAGTVHFYHQATPLSLALQYLKMHHDLTSFSSVSSSHPN